MFTSRITERTTSTKTQEHKDFPQGNHKGENPAKLPQYRTQSKQCKTQTTASLFFLAHLFFSLLQTCLSECVEMKGSTSLFIFFS